jgi:hypothetical protein
MKRNFVNDFVQAIRSDDHVIAKNDYDMSGDLDDMVYHLGKLDACEVIEHAFERMKSSDADLETFFQGFLDQMAEALDRYNKMQETKDAE